MTLIETGQITSQDTETDFSAYTKEIQTRRPTPESIDRDISQLTPVELLEQNIRTKRDEVIPLSHIYLEKAIIDDPHAEELGNSMMSDRGQLQPILVRAKLEEHGLVYYDVIDGFHRTFGSIKKHFSDIKAVVIYGCDDEEMYDLRILAVNSVKSIQFSRLIQWIQLSFEKSQFANKGIDVCQAFAIANNDSERSYLAELSPEEIIELKKWVQTKSAIWQRPISSIYQDLRIASMSDPNLTKEVRTVKGGGLGAKSITREKLRIISEKFPGKENWPVQRAVMSYANEH